MRRSAAVMIALLAAGVGGPALANQHGEAEPTQGMMSGLMMPMMSPARGRELFVSKGCVVCHAINGVGGTDAPPLDASEMSAMMNPFEFAAKMWRGAEAMIYLQQEELGEQIDFTGQELGDLIAFAHDPDEQAKLSDDDLPEGTRDLVRHGHGEADEDHHDD